MKGNEDSAQSNVTEPPRAAGLALATGEGSFSEGLREVQTQEAL